MKIIVRFGFWFGLALWTFLMGGFYGLIAFGGDFIQWFNVAFLGLATPHVDSLINALQSIGGILCLVIWLIGAVVLYFFKRMGLGLANTLRGAVNTGAAGTNMNGPTINGPTINGQSREL